MEYNPYLSKTEPGGRGEVEQPSAPNIEWQTRAAAPTEYENSLGDALEKVFAAGAQELPQVIEGLNGLGSRDAAGQPWTEASFQAEMKRLAG